jgi:two-component system NtrC family sensor kinase
MKLVLIFLLLLPLTLLSQNTSVFRLTAKGEKNTKFASGWIALDSGWKFKAGDNPEWAMPDFGDSSWQPITLFQDLNVLTQIPKNDIAWFRLRLIADSTMNRQLVMRVYQTGASEVYLNGKQIHQLGTVSSNPDSVKYYSPNSINLSFPIISNTEQTLAIRFANLPQRYPIYLNPRKSNLEVWVSPLDNASDDAFVKYYKAYSSRLNIGIGVAIILGVLYLSFFLFFPLQKINLYFSLSNFFFALFLNLQVIFLNSHESLIYLFIPIASSIVFYLLLLLYCIYKTFDQKVGWVFWSLLLLGIIAIPLAFIVPGDLISSFLGLLVLFDMFRICIKSLKTNKTGARIILVSVNINLIYWICNPLSTFSIIHIPDIETYVPFVFLISPLCLAIYLGYDFGKTSQSLRQKLTEVEQLSNEKQQILSSQNEILEEQVTERTAELNQSLENLKSAQAQLIQSEKMASLGELTAGIAHEIQNPLNFVNNFSEVNTELIDELQTELKAGNTEDVFAISNDIKDNEEKILHHGKRAEAIVKGMLQHSRASTGKKESTDINALADEYLRLSYHGMRAKDKNFNADFKTDFDESIGKINVVPQDIGRVLLNLFNNAFYAVGERRKVEGVGYEPVVSVSTKKMDEKIEMRVKDNGTGIPQKVVDKIFQPFFTTKPTGQGTGLGLSLSYDIITKEHNGTIRVESKEGEGSEFVIQLQIIEQF